VISRVWKTSWCELRAKSC